MSLIKALSSLVLLLAASLSIWVLLINNTRERPDLVSEVSRKPQDSTWKTSHAEPSSAPAASQPASRKLSKAQNEVTVKDGRLTVVVEERPLESVLDAISRQSGVTIINDADLGAAKVSRELHNVPIDKGLQELLPNWDVFIFYAGGQAEQSMQTAWIYPKGRGQELMPAPLTDRAAPNETLLPKPSTSAAGITAQDTKESKNGMPLAQALSDPDDELRYRRLEESVNTGQDVPEELLQGLLEGDPSEDVRALALEAIVGASEATRERIRELVEGALADPSDAVRARAEQILGRVDELERMDLESGQAELFF